MSAGNEIGDLLLDIGLITPEELATAHQEQAKSGERLTLVLERLGLVSYHGLKDALELQFGVNFFSLSKTPPSREIADVLKLETKLKHRVIPVASSGSQYTIAMVNPDDLIALDTVRVELKSGHLKKVVCTADEFEYFVREIYEVDKDGSSTKVVKAPVPDQSTLGIVKPQGAKVPAKNQLQSLFGDDNDDDDDFAMPTKVRKPAASVTSNTLPALSLDIMLSPMVSPSVAPELLDELRGSLDPADNHKEEQATPTNGSSPPAVATSSAEPPTLTAAAPLDVPTPAPIPDPIPAAALVPDSAFAPAVAPLHQSVPAATAADVLPLELSIEDVVAGVASHLVESLESNQVLNNNASRQLLEEVVESELGGMEETDINKLKEQQDSSIMLLAHEIIGKATQKRCSDIQLEPDSNGVALRYFLHGKLLADCVLPGEIHQALVSSYKIIAGLDPNVLERPQDKKIVTKVEDDHVELRITTMPSAHGELVAISMRFIEASG